MKLIPIPISTVIISCFCMSGCGGDANAESPLPVFGIELLHGEEYAFHSSNTIKQTKIITSSDYYQSELLQYSSDQPVDIDFSNNKVLLINMGTRNSGGYSLSIDNSKTSVDERSVTVEIIFSVPGDNCITTDTITSPYVFYRIPTQKEILLKEELIVTDCE